MVRSIFREQTLYYRPHKCSIWLKQLNLCYIPTRTLGKQNWAVLQRDVCVALLLNNFDVALETIPF